ncbi:hypothetical protein JKP75_18490 [Blastococcus sp. TML/M2B]|uniref:hypothetical protein n=1 Tax=Blastococcus sp. TML/M2B TaxID=2798727 RepID=UPI00190AA742|nr:hypothetical protein [Blastococcus sp. TML/M2B]MBN1094358.1 hypothetical protein [Blastococcus sp. TML/M2B]
MVVQALLRDLKLIVLPELTPEFGARDGPARGGATALELLAPAAAAAFPLVARG